MQSSDIRKVIGSSMLADGMSPIIDLEKSHGSWLVDKVTGKEYLDLFSMFASLSVGYNHPYVLEQSERLKIAAINKPTNSDVYSLEMAEFIETFKRLAQPSYLPHTFFIEGGTLAVENALKTSFDWKVRHNMAKGKGEKGSQVLHLKQCFHGRSGYTLSLTDSPDSRKVQYYPKFDWPRVTNPSMIFPMNEENTAIVTALEEQSLTEIKEAIHNNADDIACIILEPIQGEGGDNHFRNDYLVKVKEIALDNDILLIYDEVQTGVGITGKMWAHQHFSNEARPDIISFGKKTQTCGIYANDRIDEIEENVFNRSSRINSTWGGNLVDMVRCTKFIEIIERDHIADRVTRVGEYVLEGLRDIARESDVFTSVRGKGSLIAFTMPSVQHRSAMLSSLMDSYVIALPCGTQSVRFRLPLIMTIEEAGELLTRVKDAIQAMQIAV